MNLFESPLERARGDAVHRPRSRSGPPPSGSSRLVHAAVGTRWRAVLSLLAVLVGVCAFAAPKGVDAAPTGFPSVGTNFAGPGPFAVTVAAESAHTYYSPTTLGTNGRHPVILWGNGTFNTPSTYTAYLTHLASHGFIVAAANTSNSGSGREMLAGLDNLTTKNSQAGNRFFGQVDLTRVAVMGYSQGGGGAMAAAKDPRVDTSVPIQPWNASASGIRVPTLFMSGSSDTVVNPTTVEGYFNSSSGVPAAYGNLRGATHSEVLGDGGGFSAPATAWVRYFLMGDPNAKGMFIGASCTLCTSSAWATYRANARLATATPIDPPVTVPTTSTTVPATTSTTVPATTSTTIRSTTTTTRPPTTCLWWQWWCRR